jgi:hypothetical protein
MSKDGRKLTFISGCVVPGERGWPCVQESARSSQLSARGEGHEGGGRWWMLVSCPGTVALYGVDKLPPRAAWLTPRLPHGPLIRNNFACGMRQPITFLLHLLGMMAAVHTEPSKKPCKRFSAYRGDVRFSSSDTPLRLIRTRSRGEAGLAQSASTFTGQAHGMTRWRLPPCLVVTAAKRAPCATA